MAVTEQSIDVDATAESVYEQWSRFEEFPRFMDGVRRVRRIGDDRLQWVSEVCDRELEWEARIIEQSPGREIAWQSEGRLFNAGRVTFTPLGPDRTRVTLRIEYDPHDIAEALGYKLGPKPDDVRGDLETFKELVEETEPEKLQPSAKV